MNKYEIMFIVKTNIESEKVTQTIDELKRVFKKDKIIEFKDMGQKKLAYPIKKELSGFYYVLAVESTVKEVEEFKHKVSINENILRHLIIKLDEE